MATTELKKTGIPIRFFVDVSLSKVKYHIHSLILEQLFLSNLDFAGIPINTPRLVNSDLKRHLMTWSGIILELHSVNFIVMNDFYTDGHLKMMVVKDEPILYLHDVYPKREEVLDVIIMVGALSNHNLPGSYNSTYGILNLNVNMLGLRSDDSDYKLGKTFTHEIGHHFGLQHTHNELGRCLDNDGFTDTNVARKSSMTNHRQVTCGTRDSSENYLSYTEDVGMFMFSKQQIKYMRKRIRRLVDAGLLVITSKRVTSRTNGKIRMCMDLFDSKRFSVFIHRLFSLNRIHPHVNIRWDLISIMCDVRSNTIPIRSLQYIHKLRESMHFGNTNIFNYSSSHKFDKYGLFGTILQPANGLFREGCLPMYRTIIPYTMTGDGRDSCMVYHTTSDSCVIEPIREMLASPCV
jgi:hypothetical protein